MSWLNDRTIKYIFSNGIDEVIIERNVADDIPKAPKGFIYKGFVPEKTNITTKVQFVQNGRIGYKIDNGNGKPFYRSATKERYEHIMGNTGSDAFKEAKRQGKPIDTTETVFEPKYGKAIKEIKDKKDLDSIKKLNKALKGINNAR